MDTETVCTCRGEVHDECRPCTDCGEAPALNTYDGADGDWCDDCWDEQVEAEEQRIRNERALTKQQQAWFDAYSGTPDR